MKKILITVPCLHWLHKSVAATLLKLQQDKRYRLTVKFPSNKPYENNQHHIIEDLKEGNWDYWLSIDDDNPPQKNPLDLVELDKDIIGLPTPVWHWKGEPGERPVYWNAYDYDPETDAYREHQVRDGLQKVDAIGTGCFLMARRVFEHPEMQGAVFSRKLYPNGTVNKGNDLSFCERAKQAGFEIYAHFDYWCDQYSEVSLNSVAMAMRGMREAE